MKYLEHKYTTLLLLIMCLLPFLVLCSYAHPQVDDFAFAYKVKQLGFWEAQHWWYETWLGRYTSTALISIISIENTIYIYFIFILLSIFFIYIYINVIFKNSISLLEKIFFSLGFYLIFLLNMPHTAEGIYWLAGAGSYQSAVIFCLLFLAILHKQSETDERSLSHFGMTLLASMTIFLAGGCNETTLFLLFLFIVYLNIFNILVYKKLKINNIVYFLSISLAAYFVLTAQGNAVRHEEVVGAHRIIYSLLGSAAYGGQQLLNWVFYSPVLLWSVLYVPLALRLEEEHRWRTIHPFLAFLLLLSLVCGAYFPSLWAKNSLPTAQILNFIYFVFLMCYLYFLQCLVVFYKDKVCNFNFLYIKKYFNVFILISAISSPNLLPAYRDWLGGGAAEYDRAWQQRYAMLQQCGGEICELPALVFPPKTIFFKDFQADGNHWLNRAFAGYLGKNKIIITQPNNNANQAEYFKQF